MQHTQVLLIFAQVPVTVSLFHRHLCDFFLHLHATYISYKEVLLTPHKTDISSYVS